MACYLQYSYISKPIDITKQIPVTHAVHLYTVKPVCNDHLFNNIYYLWLIQVCVLMKTEGTNLLLLTIYAIWSSSMWPLAT